MASLPDLFGFRSTFLASYKSLRVFSTNNAAVTKSHGPMSVFLIPDPEFMLPPELDDLDLSLTGYLFNLPPVLLWLPDHHNVPSRR